jgi:bifunctional non-homologous end joining protein LigD
MMAGVRLTHPDRVLFQEQGISKRQLAAYLEAVAPVMLPHLAHRPLTLVRCPQGRQRACFLQRHPAPGTPAELTRVELPDEGDGGTTTLWLTADHVQALVALAQIGTLEFHPWLATVERPERPDRLILDLDPADGLPFTAVIEVALRLRQLLTDAGLESFVKTTGGKGLHVVAPVLPEHSWETLRATVKALAERLAAEAPDRFTTSAAKADRPGRIFVDYLRNARGASAVAPYSPRAKPAAPVAMPLAWDDLTPDLEPARFSVATVPGLLVGRPDPWAELPGLRQQLRPVRPA